ncbi:DUF2292 domain-containing protein [Eremococcus coleocola]|uniref:DUF2292 domain-containing protein n=1 Tax=Eremococcus coleocola TaxID=88132 RepID=UPI0004187813|nr:DUF2292 domain-containing protein [Eremococcus coleocola]
MGNPTNLLNQGYILIKHGNKITPIKPLNYGRIELVIQQGEVKTIHRTETEKV